MAFPIGWGKKQEITIDISGLSLSGDVSNFPYLLTEVAFDSGVFDDALSTGADLRFTSDEAGTTELPFEIVDWDNSTDKAQIWVKIPTVDYDASFSIWVWYENSGASAYGRTDTYGSDNVWTNHEVVYHLEDLADSSPNEYDLTNSGAVSAGAKIDDGYDFERSESDKQTVSAPNAKLTTAQTWFAWINPETVSSGNYHIMGFRDSDNSDQKRFFITNDKLSFQMAGLSPNSVTSGGSLSTGTLYRVVGRYDGSNLAVFINGVKTEVSVTGTITSGTSNVFALGILGEETTGNYFDGIIDEARIYDGDLSDDFVDLDYYTTNSPATYITAGTPVSTGVDDERESEVSGKEAVGDDRDSEVHGKESVSDERESEITGIRNYSERESEITGVNMSETSDRDSEITGLIPSSERESEITGIFDDGDERGSEVSGILSVNDERESEIEGSLPFSTRNTQIIGKQNKELPRFYRILVKDGSGNVIGEFNEFRTLKFGKRLNNFGMASFEVPVTDDKATDLISLRVYTVWIYRQESADSVLVWAGEQAMRDVELDDNGAGWVTIYCYTWFEQLKDRFTDAEEEYDGIDAGEIAWDLIDTTQTPSNADFGITEGTITTTVNRDRTYYNQNIMEAIINLANVVSGFDFEITDEKVFNVYDVMGEDKTDDVMFEYGTNISSIRITEDFVTPVNRGIVLGIATDETTLQRVEYDNASLQSTYKIRESVINEMDVSESATLEDKGEALVRKYGSKLIKVEPRMTKSAAINITSFGLGDVVRLVVEHGIYSIDEDYRVFEWEVTYNSDNSEDLALVLGNFTL